MLMTTTIDRELTRPKFRSSHLNKAAVEVQEKEQRGYLLQREYRQRSPTGPTALGDTQAPARQIMFRNAKSNCHLGALRGTSRTASKSDPSSNK